MRVGDDCFGEVLAVVPTVTDLAEEEEDFDCFLFGAVASALFCCLDGIVEFASTRTWTSNRSERNCMRWS